MNALTACVVYVVISVLFTIVGVAGFWSVVANPHYVGNAGYICILVCAVGWMAGNAAMHCYTLSKEKR